MKINVKTNKICCTCRIEYPLQKFSKSIASQDRHNDQCKTCKRIYDKQRYYDHKEEFITYKKLNLDARINQLLIWVRVRSKRKKLPFDLDFNFLKEMYKKQQGRCILTDIPFKFVRENRYPFSPSIDRIDNAKGYTKDNVRFVVYCMNLALHMFGENIFRYLVNQYVQTANKKRTTITVKNILCL
jgi:hypothetical protein